jgi:hypothetical protein
VAGWQFRPAKQVQRLMAVDAMRRLSAFQPVSDYRYVGMGGYEFIDFDLVRRALGVHKMTSIESEGPEDRYVFNRPSADVQVEIGTTNDILPTQPLDEPTIVWLDYCCPVRFDVLQDLQLLGERMLPGNMLLVTVNAAAGQETGRLKRLEGRIGAERVPMGVASDPDLDGWRTAEVQRRVILTELRKGLSQRADGTRFEQVLNTHYKDTQRMQTLAGVFVDSGADARFKDADFRSLPQARTTSDALVIKVPVLTAREVLDLESRSQVGQDAPGFSWLKDSEIESFADLHRWYPPVPAPM